LLFYLQSLADHSSYSCLERVIVSMEIKDIMFAYNDKITRLHGVSSEIEKGKITTIIGPNGSGNQLYWGSLLIIINLKMDRSFLMENQLININQKSLLKYLGLFIKEMLH